MCGSALRQTSTTLRFGRSIQISSGWQSFASSSYTDPRGARASEGQLQTKRKALFLTGATRSFMGSSPPRRTHTMGVEACGEYLKAPWSRRAGGLPRKTFSGFRLRGFGRRSRRLISLRFLLFRLRLYFFRLRHRNDLNALCREVFDEVDLRDDPYD